MTAYRSRYPGLDMITTSATVSVGYNGTKRHRLSITIRPDRDGTSLVALAGQTYCGSQRAMSGWHSLSLSAEGLTCLKCIARWRPEWDAAPIEELVTIDPVRRRFAVLPGVTIEPREDD